MSQNIRQIMRKKLKGWTETELNQLMKALIASERKAKGPKPKPKKR